MDLQPQRFDIVGQQEFLRNDVGMEFKTGGGVLDSDAFNAVKENGFIKAGTAVSKNDSGEYIPFKDLGESATPDGAGLVASDVYADRAGGKVIAGILIAGHPLESKCTGVTQEFKDEVKGYIRFDA